MPVLNVAVFGHRPTKIFIITTTGRLDRFGARIVLWLSVHTWGRWTRWLPQRVVTVISILYFVVGITQEVITHQYGGWEGAFTGLLLIGISAYLQFMAHRLRHLSGPMTEISVGDVIRARAQAHSRSVAVPIALFFMGFVSVHPDVSAIFSDATLLFWIWGKFTVTMGRTLPPKAAKRRWRMPAMPKLRLPKPIPVPS
jgi:hypothetical protein